MAGTQIIRPLPASRPHRRVRRPLYRDWRLWIGAAVAVFFGLVILDSMIVSRADNSTIPDGEIGSFESYRAKAAWVPYAAMQSGYSVLKGDTLYYTVRVDQLFQIGRQQQMRVLVSPNQESYVEKQGELDQMILSCGTGLKCSNIVSGDVIHVVGVLGTAVPYSTTEGSRGALPFMTISAIQEAP
jgi:hypothetical protein